MLVVRWDVKSPRNRLRGKVNLRDDVEFRSSGYNSAALVEPDGGGDWGPIPDFPTWFDSRISSWILNAGFFAAGARDVSRASKINISINPSPSEADATVFCPNCATEYPDDSEFWWKCGAALYTARSLCDGHLKKSLRCLTTTEEV